MLLRRAPALTFVYPTSRSGTAGSQCQDQKASGWTCKGVYSTSTCLQGYHCNATAGQCVPSVAGAGDTLANCQKACHKKPPPDADLKVCNPKTSQCEPCKDYCNRDSDCHSGSYCENGLCHGSQCQQSSTCAAQCSSDTPDLLIGTWRGNQIQKKFDMGEYDFKFQKKADGPQVQSKKAGGAVSSGSLTTDVAEGGKNIVITYDNGPLKGSVYSGAFHPWEPSTETEQDAFYFGAPNDDAPADINTAMNGTGATVYNLARCGGHATLCDFSAVFPAFGAFGTDDPISDPCTNFPTCTQCIAAQSSVCGWCSTRVVYNNVTTGSQCAGFDSTGKPLGWVCTGTFNKDACADYGCDWSDIKNPKCTVCADPSICSLTKDDCTAACVAPPTLYQCLNSTGKPTCSACKSQYCNSDADCPNSYCNKHGIGPWSCHGSVPGGCSAITACTAACGAATESKYLCDKYSGQCKPTSNDNPAGMTKYECSHQCKGAQPIGTWRGIEISKAFTVGEYDFTFYSDSTLHIRMPDGTVGVSNVTGVNTTETDVGMSIAGTVVSGPGAGSKFNGLFKIDTNGNDGIANMLFWGQAAGPVATFDDAMAGKEFVMLGCKKEDEECDFSAATVPASWL